MTAFIALLLGLIQGITEFFPVSSSAHLKLAKKIFHIQESSDFVLFDLVCHFGTLCALVFFLRKDLYQLIFKERKELIYFLIALFPLVPFYFLLKPVRIWCSQDIFLGVCLIFSSLILFSGELLRKTLATQFKKSKIDALWIGSMQAIALIPGISRSASTISMARYLGWSAKDAVRFSFLLAIPTIIGGSGLEFTKHYFSTSPLFIDSPIIYLIAFLSSSLSGLIFCHLAIAFLQKGNLKPCAWYCLTLGLLISIYYLGHAETF